MITVKELIEHLQKYPQDTVIGVMYRLHSDYEPMELQEIEFYGKAERDSDSNYPRYSRPERYVLRNGRIMEYDPLTWPKDEEPQFIPLLIFPGN
jgi:hypothetical protein